MTSITGKVSTSSDNMQGMREDVESGNVQVHPCETKGRLKENNQLEKIILQTKESRFNLEGKFHEDKDFCQVYSLLHLQTSQ